MVFGLFEDKHSVEESLRDTNQTFPLNHVSQELVTHLSDISSDKLYWTSHVWATVGVYSEGFIVCC